MTADDNIKTTNSNIQSRQPDCGGEEADRKVAKRIETTGPIPRWRLWLFRFIAVVIIPTAVLLGLELCLRLVGYGYSASALRKITLKGQASYCNNYQFGWRFWPRPLAREFEPFMFTEKKPKDTYRIFILGGSAALGTPEPAYSFSRSLEVMLKNQYPQVNFEVINTAITASNSHVVLPIAKDCAPGNDDLFVVYLGNNEVIGPYGAGTVFAPLSDDMSFIRLDKAMQTTKAGQLFKRVLKGGKTDSAAPMVWGGTKMFMENLVRADDENLQVVYKHFKRNLEDITQTIRKEGADVILCSVGSNLRDCAPFVSLHRKDMTDDEKGDWAGLYEQGAGYELLGKHADALRCYRAACEIDSDFAVLHFRMARAYWQLGDFAKATEEYVLAREKDALRLRADNRINRIVHHVAEDGKGKGVYFVDSVSAFGEHSPHNTPGEELFYEHVHLNFKGNYILAKTVFDQVEKILPRQLRSKKADLPVLSEEECAEKLAYTQWDKYAITEKLLNEFIRQAPFTSRLHNEDLVGFMKEQLQSQRISLDEQTLAMCQKRYIEAIEENPADWRLHWKYARLLIEGLKKPAKGAEQQRIVAEMTPGSHTTHAEYALTLYKQGDFDEAAQCLRAALKVNPNSPQLLMLLNKVREAAKLR
ncbi:MAG: tetratricopeptide repeat protein [Planctomycetes bacterium]|nr:tetratricopeptide repeat protein [Planctomycetota bacterium]